MTAAGREERRRARIAAGSNPHADLEKTIAALLSERFDQSAVSGVRIAEHIDSDGDHILRIMIVLSGKREPDGKQLVEFVRNLRLQMRANEFPVVSFVSQVDADKIDVEAA